MKVVRLGLEIPTIRPVSPGALSRASYTHIIFILFKTKQIYTKIYERGCLDIQRLKVCHIFLSNRNVLVELQELLQQASYGPSSRADGGKVQAARPRVSQQHPTRQSPPPLRLQSQVRRSGAPESSRPGQLSPS